MSATMITAESVRGSLAAGQPIVGRWSLIGDVGVAALAASGDVDYVVLDLQHGSYTEHDVPGATAAIRARGRLPLVRTRSPDYADIGRPLDLGAAGVIVPSTAGLEAARAAIAAATYGPEGTRSIGRYLDEPGEPLRILVLETADSLSELEQIVQLDGLDAIYVGPTDLALSLGKSGPAHADEVEETISAIIQRCRDAGMPVGVHTTQASEAARYAALGCTVLTATVDTAAFTRAFATADRSVVLP